MAGNKNAFFGAMFGPNCQFIIAHCYNGSCYYWTKTESLWQILPFIAGHFDQITDLDWSSNGEYLVTCSKD